MSCMWLLGSPVGAAAACRAADPRAASTLAACKYRGISQLLIIPNRNLFVKGVARRHEHARAVWIWVWLMRSSVRTAAAAMRRSHCSRVAINAPTLTRGCGAQLCTASRQVYH
jgi:hypothetical protein